MENCSTYQRVTTSFEYVFVGNDFALASPAQNIAPSHEHVFTNSPNITNTFIGEQTLGKLNEWIHFNVFILFRNKCQQH